MKINISLLLIGLSYFSLEAQSAEEDARTYRETWKSEMLADPRSPLDSADFQYVEWFTPQADYKVRCRFERLKDAANQEIPTFSGQQKMYRPYGKLWFHLDNKLHTLTIYEFIQNPVLAGMHDHLFLPFKDQTNGELTYGGGRYLDLKKADLEGGNIHLDFNHAYNPWCAYSSGYNCPIPPFENQLSIGIHAGEKLYKGPYKVKN